MKRSVATAIAALCVACTGVIGEAPADLDPTQSDSFGGVGSVIDRGLPNNRTSAGLRLLTPTEYRFSIEDALGVTVAPSEVPQQQVVFRHSQIGSAQAVGLDEVTTFLDLGLSIATRAVDAATGCELDTLSCAEAFARGALHRLFRGREGAELDPYLSILRDASGDAGATVRERLVTMLATALASPNFMYRSETGRDDAGVDRELDGYAIAERLSFLAWSSGPDDVLLALAKSGELIGSAVRQQQLERLLADSKARRAVRAFVGDWLDLVNRSGIANKDDEVLAGTTATLEDDAATALGLTIDDVLFSGDGNLTSLLATDRYFMNPAVAAVLGATAPGTGFASVGLDTAVRRGLLLFPTVLAAHTKEVGASPFSIGRFIYESVLCEMVPLPGKTPSLDSLPIVGGTLRERLESATGQAPCSACHSLIGPPGFAFLPFDPIGRYSAQDGGGRPWDTTGTLLNGDTTIDFAGAADLSEKLARDPVVAQCAAKRVFRWTFGRFEGADDAPLVAALMQQATSDGANLKALLRTVVTSRDFTRVRREQ